MRQFMSHDLFIFDCDGVILDSNRLKFNAMENALRQQGEVKGGEFKALEMFEQNFGKTRSAHLDDFINHCLILAKDADVNKVKSGIIDTYSALVDRAYASATPVPGLFSILKKLPSKPFVASGADQNQLRTVLSKMSLAEEFAGIFGGPRKKREIVEDLLLDANVRAGAVLVGDSSSDLAVAKELGINFVGMYGYANSEVHLIDSCNLHGFRLVRDWRDLASG